MSPGAFGSARVLEGRIYPLSMFISVPGFPWAPEEKAALMGFERQAEAWIQRQALRYRVPLAFLEGGAYGYVEDVQVDHIPSWQVGQPAYWDWAEYLIRRIGWASGWSLAQDLCERSRADGLHLTIYANAEGRSHALPAYSPDGNLFVEASFLYQQGFDGHHQISPRLIAHETLHLYGAWDLYENGCVTREQADAAQRWFPTDVMATHADLERLDVGPLTAWRIGWAPRSESWYEWFRPGC
jgi:hypothetical protein